MGGVYGKRHQSLGDIPEAVNSEMSIFSFPWRHLFAFLRIASQELFFFFSQDFVLIREIKFVSHPPERKFYTRAQIHIWEKAPGYSADPGMCRDDIVGGSE